MKNRTSEVHSNPADWIKLSGYAGRLIKGRHSPLAIVSYSIHADSSGLKGKKILFFSDLHWNKHLPDEKLLIDSINACEADWLVFGGDLVTYTSFMAPAADFLGKLKAARAKIAVFGNWDKRRRRWMPHAEWEKLFAAADFKLLVNQSFSDKDIFFYGMDDYKLGMPYFQKAPSDKLFSVLISHNPDAVLDCLSLDDLSNVNLALCGHTHGGQVRLPLFGALKTSSVFWKKFEYGLFRNRQTASEMIVSSGVGTSSIPIRFFCDPELVLIDFI